MPSLLTSPAALLSLVVVLGGSVVMGREGGLLGGLFFLPFCFGPLLVNAVLATLWRRAWVQVLLAGAALAHLLWFGWVWRDVKLHPDPQAAIAFLVVGPYALPPFAAVWLLAWWLQRCAQGHAQTPQN
jgi:hypothetical protein